jgi:hypothetical protein
MAHLVEHAGEPLLGLLSARLAGNERCLHSVNSPLRIAESFLEPGHGHPNPRFSKPGLVSRFLQR